MIKAIVLLSKLPHVTRQQFMDYYEANHAPFILAIRSGVQAYRRNHVRGDSANMLAPGDTAPFDAVTELQFADEAAYANFVAESQNPAISRQVRADEANFLDFTKSRLFKVREHTSPILRAPDDLKKSVKVILLLSRLPHVSPAGFAAYYDNNHAPFMAGLLPQIRVYRRNHVLEPPFNPAAPAPPLPFDTLTELRFRDEDGYQSFLKATHDPRVREQILADEAHFLDPAKSRMFRVEERTSTMP